MANRTNTRSFPKLQPPSPDASAVRAPASIGLEKRFTDLLGEHNVALALTDHSYMPRPWEMKTPVNLITADFTYVRWLGDPNLTRVQGNYSLHVTHK